MKLKSRTFQSLESKVFERVQKGPSYKKSFEVFMRVLECFEKLQTVQKVLQNSTRVSKRVAC